MSPLLAIHLAATWYMTGLVWMVQIVHYPMLGRTRDCFSDCHGLHMARMGAVVGPVMLVEAGTAIALVLARPAPLLWANLAALAVIWVSTFAVQVPLHRRLGNAGPWPTTRSSSEPTGCALSCGRHEVCYSALPW